MVKIYQRYLAAQFILPFLFSALFFVTFLLTFQLFQVMQVVIGKDVENLLILHLIGHIALSFLPMAIPISILFATIYTMSRFSEDSELIAFRAFGISKFRLFLPIFLMTLMIALALFSLNRSLIPNSRAQFRNTLIVLSSQGMLSNVKPEQFYMEIPGVTLFAESVSESGDEFGEVFILLSDSRGVEEKVITARKGKMLKSFEKQDQFTQPTLRMFLENGNITTTRSDDETVEVIHFQEYDFPIVTDFFGPSTIARDSMRTNRHLKELIDKRVDRLKELEQKSRLRRQERLELEELEEQIPKSLIEYFSRFNTPVQCLVFSLLGFSLGVKQGRGKSKNSGGMSIIIVIAYYVVFFTGASLTQRGIVSPMITTFLPTLVAFLFALYYFKKVDWLS